MHAFHFAPLVVLFLFGCAPTSKAGQAVGRGGTDDGATEPIPQRNNGRIVPSTTDRLQKAALVVTTYEGQIAVLRASDGVELGRTDSGGYGGLIDLSYDDKQSGLVAYEEDDEGEGAEISFYPLHLENGRATFGTRSKLAWVDGIARVLALPEGLVSFSENIGQRWSIWKTAPKPAPSIACPRPASLAIDRTGGLTKLVGVTAPFPTDNRAQRVEVTLTDTGFGDCQLDDLPNAPASARLIELDDGAELLAGVANGKLSVSVVGQRALELGGPLDLALGSVEEALVIDPAIGRVALLLRDPARVVVFDVESSDGRMSIRNVSHIDLTGEVREEQQFFSREMASIENRIFVATDTGIEAIDIDDDGGKISLRLGALTENGGMVPTLYRGPIVALVAD